MGMNADGGSVDDPLCQNGCVGADGLQVSALLTYQVPACSTDLLVYQAPACSTDLLTIFYCCSRRVRLMTRSTRHASTPLTRAQFATTIAHRRSLRFPFAVAAAVVAVRSTQTSRRLSSTALSTTRRSAFMTSPTSERASTLHHNMMSRDV